MDVRINGSVQIPGQPMDSGIVQVGRRSKWVWVNEFLPIGQRVTITDEAAPACEQCGGTGYVCSYVGDGDHRVDDCACGLNQQPAPSPDAELDEATVTAAEAWGVGIQQVYVVPAEVDAYGAWARVSGEMSKWAYGPTRLAALEALAALATPKLKPVEEMTGKELIDEIRQRTGDVAATGMIALRQTVTALRAQVKD